MVRGFYQLGAGLMTQTKMLNGIGNNITNSKTNGYKKQRVISSTFETMMLNRIDSTQTPIGQTSMLQTVGENATIHSQGSFENTGRNLDFAISGAGFFAVEGTNGRVYTRKGSFNIDDEGYLVQQPAGRVLGQNGPIQVNTAEFTADAQGNIFVDGKLIDRLAVYDFSDYNNLQQAGEGFYQSNANAQLVEPNLVCKTIEGSNVDVSEEITMAIASQRELQSCSQMIKIYDQVLAKATTDLGRV